MTTPDGESYALPEWAEEWAIHNGAAKTVAEARQSNYLMSALKRAHGAVKRMKMLSSITTSMVFGDGWPSTVSLGDGYQRYGPTYFNAQPRICGRSPRKIGPRAIYDRRIPQSCRYVSVSEALVDDLATFTE